MAHDRTALRTTAALERRRTVAPMIQRSAAAPISLSPAQALQERLGSHAAAFVAGSMAAPAIHANLSPAATGIQRLLALGSSPEAHEAEAEHAASLAASQMGAGMHLAPRSAVGVTPASGVPGRGNGTPMLLSAGRNEGSTGDIESRIDRVRGSGHPLDRSARHQMESAFGVDLGGVRVHTGTEPNALNEALQATAFTTGHDIFFRDGAYDPASIGGRRLLAHELTHVVQQNGGSSVAAPAFVQRRCSACEEGELQAKFTVSDPLDADEIEADAVAERVVGMLDRASSTAHQAAGGHARRPAGRPADLQRAAMEDEIDEGRVRFPTGANAGPAGMLVQRLGDLTKIPATMNCPVASTSAAGAATSVLFDVNSSKLSVAARATLSGIAAAWRATDGTLRIDGFASVDGPDELNWQLSCDRANAVARELEAPSDGSPGVPNANFQIFAQGETNEFSGSLPPNRRVVITTIGAAPAPPGPAPAPPETITSETVAVSPGARTRTTIGVGEEVRLTHSPGSAAWTTNGGTLSAANGVTVVLTAPDTAQRITVTAGAATISFDIVAPTSVTQQRVSGTGVKHNVNLPDSGIASLTFLGPDTVNFSRVRWRELDVAGVPTIPGAYLCNPASTGHCGAGGGGAPCADNPLSNIVVAGKGTQDLPPPDCAYSGHCGGAPPFVPGSLTLTIPYEYRVGTGPFRRFATVAQVHTLAADASTLTTTKAGATGTTTVASASVAIPACP